MATIETHATDIVQRLPPRPTLQKRLLTVLLVFLGLSAPVLAGLYVAYRNEVENRIEAIQQDERWRATVSAGRQAATIDVVSRDIRFLAESGIFRRWFDYRSSLDRDAVEEVFISMAKSHEYYSQVRFIDVTGKEVIRVDRDGAEVKLRPASELQDQVSRYYVTEALRLEPGSIYVSKLDLNVENGTIEYPIKPMLRFATPVFDTAGRKQGIVVLNYLAAEILERLRRFSLAGKGEPWMIDSSGYWLDGPANMTWAFMFPNQQDGSFAKSFPDAWRQIVAGSSAGQIEIDGEMFSFAKVTLPPNIVPNRDALATANGRQWLWLVLTHWSAARLEDIEREEARSFRLISAVLLPLFGLLAFGAVDLHTRWRLAEKMREEGEAREKVQRLAALLVESLPNAVVAIAHDGSITQVNAAAEEMFGYSRAEVAGKPVEHLMSNSVRAYHTIMRKNFVLPDQYGYRMGQGKDMRALHKSGREFSIDVSLGQFHIGAERHYIACITDISVQRDLEKQSLAEKEQIRNLAVNLENRVAERTAELEATNAELETFCYSVSHDLRAPLRSIDGFSQILEDDFAESLAEPGRQHVGRIRAAAQRMGHLIDDLLNLSRITRVDLECADVDLSAQAREVIAALRAREPDRVVEADIADAISAKCDPRLLMIVLENLVGNAWKFTAERAVARISFGAMYRDGKRTFYVRDNGAGFDMAYADKLFGAFQRLHQESRFSGHGIGLATAHRVVTKHGGRIWAEAVPDQGATFYFVV